VASVLDAVAVTYGRLAEGIEHAAWSEDGGDSPNLIILRRAGDPDGYTLIVNDNPRYGGVLDYEVNTGETRLALTAEAAHELGVERDIRLRFQASAVEASGLRSALAMLLMLEGDGSS
jgi:predicted aspartyl protease